MAKFHPSVDLLTEYVAGILPLAQSACISAHLNYCPQCQQQSARLQDLGAVLFESLTPVPVGQDK